MRVEFTFASLESGVNGQTTAKTALHTSDKCDMYAHVPPWAKSGDWEWVSGIPDTFTGAPDARTAKAADDCWVSAPHQWANEGCTAVHDRNDTIGAPVNAHGGGVYVLEWDPQVSVAVAIPRAGRGPHRPRRRSLNVARRVFSLPVLRTVT